MFKIMNQGQKQTQYRAVSNSQQPKCKLCSKAYDMYYHVPRVSKCGHTFCQHCIKNLATAWKGRIMFTCPIQTCKGEVQIRRSIEEQLPKNISIVEIVKQNKLQNAQFISDGHQEQTDEVCEQHQGHLKEIVCLTCQNVKICSHCVIFGSHKGHNVSAEQPATSEDKQQLIEVMKIIENTMQCIIVPEAEHHIQKQNMKKLVKSMKDIIKQKFKTYYTQLKKKENDLLQQCQRIMLDQKGTELLSDLTNKYQSLKVKTENSSTLARTQVDKIINSAKELHQQIQTVVKSYEKSVDKFIGQAKKKIGETNFFNIIVVDHRTLKNIIGGVSSPEKKSNRSTSSKMNEKYSSKNKNQETESLQETGKRTVSSSNNKKSLLIGKMDFEKDNNHPENLKRCQNQALRSVTEFDTRKNEHLKQKTSKQKNGQSITNVFESKILEQTKKTSLKNSIINQKRAKSVRQPKAKEVFQENHNNDELKFIKPLKQLNYELRPKLQQIISQIDRQPNQGTLQLIGLEISDTIIPYICNYLNQKKLKYTMIKLVKNGLTDEGARILLSYLVNDRYTKVLNLTGNSLTSLTLNNILKLTQTNKILKTFYLTNNKINSMQVKKIQSQLEQNFVQIIV